MIDKSFEALSKKDKNISLSINITEDDLLSKQLKEYLLKRLKRYSLNPNQIVLEILEGISSAGTKESVKQLKELKEVGFLLAIDDFGVEYSNFERINELDVDFIKIDAKYIKNIDTNPKSYKIVKAITEFASSMQIKTIAEYVENEQIQKIIEELGIEFSQGYYFSKPSPEF
ncbi:diguanylate cyclase/phosphodiesterase (GGDEF & EAL domains) with PAS/PAC sensor(s) [hydrothermal vent metagenome]|uniref:Diguanylate cyclase/phosphodiesterase (GGDEF & EAL domains) with PAS/PAC sensor(S) n=1 Tax=hydrothermal vent metagenome TaxID=652676 RepID=A0A1W1B900_9ZZZZ